MSGKLLFSVLLISVATGLFAQRIQVGGTISDSASGEVMPGVNVIVQSSGEGTISDGTGNWSIMADRNDSLVYSFVGYNTVVLPVDGRTVLDVAMQESISQLNDVVVVGYGVQRKSQVTGAISSISNDDFKDQPVGNLAQSIQGRVSGLNVVAPSGTPGAGLLVSVRGNSNPLYVVDGIPLLSESHSAINTAFDTEGNGTGQGQNLSSIADLNPNDIERIEVLKDASASAIYGARAANGVILITTKRGKSGETGFSFNYYTGLQKIARPIEFMNNEQFLELVEEARANDRALYEADPTYFGEDFDASVLYDPLETFDLSSGVNTNWLDEVSRTAPISNYELSASGGNDKTRFYTSVNYFDQEGVLIDSWYKRLNYRLNLDHQVSKRFTLGNTFSATYSKNRRSFNDNTYSGIITNIIGASPFMPVYDENGDYASFEDYEANWLSDNPVKSAKELKAFTTNYRLLGSVFGEYAVLPNLRLKSSIAADLTFLTDDFFKSPITTDGDPVGGEAFESVFQGQTILNENTVTYSEKFGDHGITLLGGVTEQVTTSDRRTAIGQGFPGGGLERVSSAANIVAATSEGSSFAILSYIGRVNYDYKGRYLLTATLRTDGSSRFSKDNRYGYFPSFSFAWRISDEAFFEGLQAVNDLKFRIGYGVTGDQEIGDFQNITFYQPSRYYGKPGVNLRNIADPNLTWQSNRTFNTGFDYELLEGKFNGSFDFFVATKKGLLSNAVVPGTTGFAVVTRNGGDVQNTGFEFNINAHVVRQKDFSWTTGFNINYLKNEITALTSDRTLLSSYNDIAPTHILKVGEPIGTFWGVKYLGVDPETGDALFQDLNLDGVVDADDSQIIGKAFPDFWGGWMNNFTWKDFDLSVFCRYQWGNEVYNLIRPTYENLGWSNDGGLYSVYANNSVRTLNRWKQPGDKADYGRASFVNQNYWENSSQYIESGAFFRVQNVTLGYTFRDLAWANNLRLYFEAQNLLLISKYKGFDPEVSSTGGSQDRTAGVDYGAYPSARTLLLGVNLGF